MTIQMIHFAEERPLETSTRLCIRQDLGMILSNFMGKREADDFELGRFKAFLACWKELDCGLIHVGRLEEISKTWFLECLFDETLGNITTDSKEMVGLTKVLLW